MSGWIRHLLHNDAIRAELVRELQRDDSSGNGLRRNAIHDLPADPGLVWAHDTRRKRRLQAKSAVALLNNGSTGVEIDVEVHGLPRGHMDRATHYLPGRNFKPRVCLAAQIQRVRATTIHHTVEDVAAELLEACVAVG